MEESVLLRTLDFSSGGMEAGTASGAYRVAGGREKGAKFAGSEVIEGAEAGGELGGAEAAFAVETAQEVDGGLFSLVRIALQTAGDEVAVRVAAELDFGNDMIDALDAGTQMSQAVEAEARFSGVNGFAEEVILQEVDGLEIQGVRAMAESLSGLFRGSGAKNGANFAREKHLDHVARLAAFDQAQRATSDETTDGGASAALGDTHPAGEPAQGEMQAELAFETAVTQEMQVDDMVDHVESEMRDEEVFELFPHPYGIQFFGFHDG
jgi:hypothetical protein